MANAKRTGEIGMKVQQNLFHLGWVVLQWLSILFAMVAHRWLEDISMHAMAVAAFVYVPLVIYTLLKTGFNNARCVGYLLFPLYLIWNRKILDSYRFLITH
jgi:hypothetical protein